MSQTDENEWQYSSPFLVVGKFTHVRRKRCLVEVRSLSYEIFRTRGFTERSYFFVV